MKPERSFSIAIFNLRLNIKSTFGRVRQCLSLKFLGLKVVQMAEHTSLTMSKRSSKGRLDLNQLAKSIVDHATGEETAALEQPEKNPAAVALGRLGGRKGGKARAANLTSGERQKIAKKAAFARWRKSTD